MRSIGVSGGLVSKKPGEKCLSENNNLRSGRPSEWVTNTLEGIAHPGSVERRFRKVLLLRRMERRRVGL